MQKYKSVNSNFFKYLSGQSPYAMAEIFGGTTYPNINGTVEFYRLSSGVVVVADIDDLPETDTNIFAFHIHGGTTCDDNFINSGEHYNPTNQLHPKHAGDMPPLFSNNGCAWLAFFDERFNINDIIGKVVIIHDNPDDFTTQPAGNSGTKIACGVIKKL